MPQRTRRLPEKLYISTIGWEGWVFQVLSSSKGIRWMTLQPTPTEELEERLKARVLPDDEQNEPALNEIHAYLRGRLRQFTVPVDLRGTEFQTEVWTAIARIPYGQTVSYGELAASVGHPKATRAVGQATGANPVPILIPCHRVVGSSGSLVGFGGGLPLKERLLSLERGALRI